MDASPGRIQFAPTALSLLGWTLASDMPGDPHAGVLGVRAAIA